MEQINKRINGIHDSMRIDKIACQGATEHMAKNNEHDCNAFGGINPQNSIPRALVFVQ